MAIGKLSYSQVEDSSTIMKSTKSNMSDYLEKINSKINSVNDPEVWQSKNAEILRQRFDELSAKFPGFTEAVNNFALFLDSVVKLGREDDERNAKELEEAISSGDSSSV